MSRGVNSRVFGASLIGVGLVIGAWMLNSFTLTAPTPDQPFFATETPAPERNHIATGDRDSDGVEDWQEPFLTAGPVILDEATSTYERANTLTERAGISVMENLLTAQAYGGLQAAEPEQLVNDSVENVIREAQNDRLYTQADISVIPGNEPDVIRTYANTVAMVLQKNDVKELRNELLIFQDAMATKNPKHYAELVTIANVYQKNRDDLLALPVPAALVKQHLDLINVFEAIQKDLMAMSVAEDDPVLSLLRLKRYQDDASGLGFALQNMYTALATYPNLFAESDPALVFSQFSALRQ